MRTDALAARLPDLSARLMREMLDSHLHMSWHAFCRTFKVSANILDSESSYISAEAELSLQRGFFEATLQEPGLWIELGLRYRAAGYGAFGIAMMTAQTLADVFDNIEKYQSLTYSLMQYSFVAGPAGSGTMIGNDDAVSGRFREFTQHRDLGSVSTFLKDLVGGKAILETIHVAAAPPSNWRQVRHAFPCEVVFYADQTQWNFLPGAINTPVTLADDNLFAAHMLQCSRQLQQFRATPSISEQIIHMLSTTNHWFPTMAETAERMGMSERTLHRRLSEEGQSLSSLVNRARIARAKLLVGRRRLAVASIASELGYSDASSLSRAFKRSTGISIRDYRRKADCITERVIGESW